MNGKCFFDEGVSFCVALTEKKCEGCKFRKTKEEYRLAQIKAAEILEQKHLIPKQISVKGVPIVTTEFYRRW